jgi:hypothetical protein
MQFGRRKLTAVSILMLIGLFTVLPFQACSQIGFTDKKNKQADLNKGGEGFDGKPYWSYGPCSGQIGVSDIVMVAGDYSRANRTRENCRDLAAPQALTIDSLRFSMRDASVFELGGKVFDEQVSGGPQKITSYMCNSVGASPSVQSLIWTGAGGTLFGSVSQSNGVISGALSVDEPLAASPDRYVSAAGQSSRFDLNIDGQLSYSISGGAQVDIPQMSCSTQAPPVALVQSAAAAATGSGTVFRLNTQATGGGNLLAVGLSIFEISGAACVVSITDNAPGGGNVYSSAGAFASDSASGGAEIWYAANSRAGATQMTITLRAGCSGRRPATYFAEFSGVAAVNPLENAVAASNQPASMAPAAPQAAASSRAVVFSVTTVQFDVTGIQNGNSFNALPIVDGDNAAYFIANGAGNYGAVWAQDNLGSYGASTAVFKAAW